MRAKSKVGGKRLVKYGGQLHREKEVNLDVAVCTEVRRRKKGGLKTAGSEKGKVGVCIVTDWQQCLTPTELNCWL